MSALERQVSSALASMQAGLIIIEGRLSFLENNAKSTGKREDQSSENDSSQQNQQRQQPKNREPLEHQGNEDAAVRELKERMRQTERMMEECALDQGRVDNSRDD